MIKQTLQREIKRRIEKVKITVLGSYAENPSGLSWMAWRRWESWSFKFTAWSQYLGHCKQSTILINEEAMLN